MPRYSVRNLARALKVRGKNPWLSEKKTPRRRRYAFETSKKGTDDRGIAGVNLIKKNGHEGEGVVTCLKTQSESR